MNILPEDIDLNKAFDFYEDSEIMPGFDDKRLMIKEIAIYTNIYGHKVSGTCDSYFISSEPKFDSFGMCDDPECRICTVFATFDRTNRDTMLCECPLCYSFEIFMKECLEEIDKIALIFRRLLHRFATCRYEQLVFERTLKNIHDMFMEHGATPVTTEALIDSIKIAAKTLMPDYDSCNVEMYQKIQADASYIAFRLNENRKRFLEICYTIKCNVPTKPFQEHANSTIEYPVIKPVKNDYDFYDWLSVRREIAASYRTHMKEILQIIPSFRGNFIRANNKGLMKHIRDMYNEMDIYNGIEGTIKQIPKQKKKGKRHK